MVPNGFIISSTTLLLEKKIGATTSVGGNLSITKQYLTRNTSDDNLKL